MNKKCYVSIGIAGMLVLTGLIGVLNFTGGIVSGTDIGGIVYDGAGGPFTAIGSPYKVQDDLTIPVGETLTIEPGVEIRFNGYYGLIVEGTLIAKGTDTRWTLITSNRGIPGPGDWSRISIASTGHAEIEFCRINYGTIGIYLDSSSNNDIVDNNIGLNKDNGISLSHSSLNTISRNNVSDNFQGVYLFQSHINTISHNIISNNRLPYNTPNGTVSSKDTGNIGLKLYLSNDNNIYENEASQNGDYGSILTESQGNSVIDNTFYQNKQGGILLRKSNGNNIQRNTITEGKYGILMNSSTYNLISANIMLKNGVVIQGDRVEHWNTHEIPRTNTINGKDVFYIKNQIGGASVSNAGAVILANSKNIRIENQDIRDTTIGIQMGFSSNNHVQNNIISHNTIYGILIIRCYGNIVSGNTVTFNYEGIFMTFCNANYIVENDASWNTKKGIHLDNSNGNYLTRNTASYNVVDTNTGYGIFIINSNRNHIAQNILFHNGYGLGIWYSLNSIVYANRISTDRDRENQWGGGIHLFYCTKATLYSNKISKSGEGIYIQDSNAVTVMANNISTNKGEGIRHWVSNGVIISYNDLWDNGIGIRMFDWSRNILVHHNNIIGNEIQALDYYSNDWDYGYPSGGNFWSDYNGVDLNNGPDQNIPGSDGIGDSPCVIDGDSQDDYPLMERVQSNDDRSVLCMGWNLISIPFIQSENGVEHVLSSIHGTYESLQWYNSADSKDPWKNYHTNKPMDLNEFNSLDHTMGMWIKITEPEGVIFDYSGSLPVENQNIYLRSGWNMVGYPSLNNYERNIALNNLNFGIHVDAIWTFDSATQQWIEMGQSDQFEKGRGYWIHSKVDGTWEVPL